MFVDGGGGQVVDLGQVDAERLGDDLHVPQDVGRELERRADLALSVVERLADADHWSPSSMAGSVARTQLKNAPLARSLVTTKASLSLRWMRSASSAVFWYCSRPDFIWTNMSVEMSPASRISLRSSTNWATPSSPLVTSWANSCTEIPSVASLGSRSLTPPNSPLVGSLNSILPISRSWSASALVESTAPRPPPGRS